MTARLLLGRPVADEIEAEVAGDAKRFLSEEGRKPTLAVVMVGENPASEVYVSKKREACDRVGIHCCVHHLSNTKGLDMKLTGLSKDDGVDGIILQLPLPGTESPASYFPYICQQKDVDVFAPTSVGLLDQGCFDWEPCTPGACMRILQHYKIPTHGREMVILNRSWVVGRPLMGMALHKGIDATVTVCHDMTPAHRTLHHCKEADIIVVAVGRPDFLTPDMVRSGQTIIDVGINRVGNKVVGDVHKDVASIVENLTPCPGGVGPVTVASLVQNVVKAAFLRRG
jgi:methylenetetrahydrofolate dehydrogenase (NADP+) / methenyltetrahydrofolate cyclohydrolase